MKKHVLIIVGFAGLAFFPSPIYASGGSLKRGKKYTKDRQVARGRATQGKHERSRGSEESLAVRKAKRALARKLRGTKKSCWTTRKTKLLILALVMGMGIYGLMCLMNTEAIQDGLIERDPTPTFPSYIHNFPHPGKVSAPTNISTVEEVNSHILRLNAAMYKMIEENPELKERSIDEINDIVRPFLQKFYRTCEIDERLDNMDPIDRTRYSIAINQLEKTILSKPFESIGNDELISALCKIHHTLQMGTEGESSFRDARMLMNTGMVGLFRVDEMRRMLALDPRALKVYEDLIAWLRKVGYQDIDISRRETWEYLASMVLVEPSDHAYDFIKRYYTFIGAPVSQIKEKIKRSFNKAKKKLAIDPIDAAGYLHMRLVEIHPFGDGNGRIARLFAFVLLAQRDINPPIIFRNEEYMKVVQQAASKNNYGIFTRYLRKVVKQTDDLFADPQKKAAYELLMKDLETCGLDCQELCEEHLKELGIKVNVSV